MAMGAQRPMFARYNRGGEETVPRGKEEGRSMQIGSIWKNRRKSYQGKKKIDVDG